MGGDKSSPKVIARNRLWTETDGAERYLAECERKRQEFERLVKSLAKCPICKGAARIDRFGLLGHGVWIGCDETDECCRYIEYHEGGWSIEDTARDWNRRNRGVLKCIRLLKRWFRVRFGKMARAERVRKRELAAKKAEEMAKKREIFGIFEPKTAKKWWKFWRMGNKYDEEKPEKGKGA